MSVLDILNANKARILSSVAGEGLEWRAKGIINDALAIYPMSTDTKLVSKVLELMISVALMEVCRDNGLFIKPAPYQNHYPDFTISDTPDFANRVAVDIKSTFRVSPTKVSGLTLGAFTGYFRDRAGSKNIVYPYNSYSDHICLVALYSRSSVKDACAIVEDAGIRMTDKMREVIACYVADPREESWGEIVRRAREAEPLRDRITALISEPYATFGIESVAGIRSVITDIDVFAQEKWKIASDRVGAGNTKNIGSVSEIRALQEGTGPFTRIQDGKVHFDTYWTHYETRDMAVAAGREGVPLFKNIETYLAWRERIAPLAR